MKETKEGRQYLYVQEYGHLLQLDCGAAVVEDIDNDGKMEVVVRTRWPEKPYTVYDGTDGIIKETWVETVDSDVAEALERAVM